MARVRPNETILITPIRFSIRNVADLCFRIIPHDRVLPKLLVREPVRVLGL